MKGLNLLVFGFVMVSYHAFCQQSLFPIEKVDSFITRIMNDWHAMGIAIAITNKDSLLLHKGYGYRDYARKLPVTGHTVFPIASCSKTFTAALMIIAAMENKIQLENPVNRYLPEFQLYSKGLTQGVSVEDLLSHRTGLAGHDWAWTFNTNFTSDVYLKRIKYLEPFAELRTKFQYSNFMYFALSALSTKLYHKSWNELISEKLFYPLEMKSSYSSNATLNNYENIAFTYEYEDSFQIQDTKQMDDLMGAASINSTAADLAHWLQMWINGGLYKNKPILSPQLVRKAISSHIVVDEGLSDQFPDEHFMNMGLSWFLSSYRGHYRANHTGNIAGFSSSITFFPYDSFGIVVLTNQNNSPLIRLIPAYIADLLFQLPVRDKNTALLAQRDAYKKNASTASYINPDTVRMRAPHSLIKYSGQFQNQGYGPVRIEPFKKSLLLTYYDLQLALLPLGGNRFSSHYFEDNKISVEGVGDILFNVNKSGIVNSFSIPFEPAVKDILFLRR